MQVIRETENAPGCVTSVFHPSPPPLATHATGVVGRGGAAYYYYYYY